MTVTCRRVATSVVLVLAATFSTTSTAHAHEKVGPIVNAGSASGWLSGLWYPGFYVQPASEGEIHHTIDIRAYTWAYFEDSWSPAPMPAYYIGVGAYGYKEGSLCASIVVQMTSGSPTNVFGVGAVEPQGCVNQSSSDCYRTTGKGRLRDADSSPGGWTVGYPSATECHLF